MKLIRKRIFNLEIKLRYDFRCIIEELVLFVLLNKKKILLLLIFFFSKKIAHVFRDYARI